MDKNISEAYIYNAYICMYYGTNFLRDTKFNNYKQHRLSDNNHNCKFLCDRYFWELFELTSGQTTRAIFFFNRAPQLFLLLQKDFKHSCKCIVISWTKRIFLSVSLWGFPVTDCLQIKVLMLHCCLMFHCLVKTVSSCWEEFSILKNLPQPLFPI